MMRCNLTWFILTMVLMRGKQLLVLSQSSPDIAAAWTSDASAANVGSATSAVNHLPESSPMPSVPHGHVYNPNMVQFNESASALYPSVRHLPFGPKRYMYAYQTKDHVPPHMKTFEQRPLADVLVMTYAKDLGPSAQSHVIYHYGPGTSWTTGRNEMLRFIKAREVSQGWKYEYIVLMDDDILFKTKKPLQLFENFLRDHQPAVGCASIPGRDGTKAPRKGTVMPVCAFDALFNAFHHEAVDVLLPYDQRYEKMSWYCSQQDIIMRTSAMYKGHILELRTVAIINEDHSDYPKGKRDARFRAAKEQQARFEKTMPEHVTRCSRWPCEWERLNGVLLKKDWDYGDPLAAPAARDDKICTHRGPPMGAEEKKYLGFGFNLHGNDTKGFVNVKPIHPL